MWALGSRYLVRSGGRPEHWRVVHWLDLHLFRTMPKVVSDETWQKWSATEVVKMPKVVSDRSGQWQRDAPTTEV
jgi:hypothetical protein